MGERGRTVLTVIVVVLVVGVPVVFLFASGGGGDDEPSQAADPGLQLEVSPGSPELVVYVEAAANEPDRAGGARSVTLRCVDADGQLVAAQDEAWPFTDTDAGTLDPHTHVTLDADRMGRIRRCSLIRTEPLLEGSLP